MILDRRSWTRRDLVCKTVNRKSRAIQWKVSRVRPRRILLPSKSARNVWNPLEPSALGKMLPVNGDLSENFIATWGNSWKFLTGVAELRSRLTYPLLSGAIMRVALRRIHYLIGVSGSGDTRNKWYPEMIALAVTDSRSKLNIRTNILFQYSHCEAVAYAYSLIRDVIARWLFILLYMYILYFKFLQEIFTANLSAPIVVRKCSSDISLSGSTPGRIRYFNKTRELSIVLSWPEIRSADRPI